MSVEADTIGMLRYLNITKCTPMKYLYHGLSLNSPLDGLNPLILKGGFNIIKAKAIGALAVNNQFKLLTYTYLRHTAI